MPDLTDVQPRRWGKAGVRLTEQEAATRDKLSVQRRAYTQQADTRYDVEERRSWAQGRVVPHMITIALDAKDLYGPEVDQACGVEEPTVDQWEAGELYPSWTQLKALASLCGIRPGMFMWRDRVQDWRNTTMRFHYPMELAPEPVLCFTPEAIQAATGTTRCPYCRLSAQPVMPAFLFCPHCGSPQHGRTEVGPVFAQCPDCAGRWPVVSDAES